MLLSRIAYIFKGEWICAVWWFKLVTNVVLVLYAYVIYHKMHQ